MSAIVIVRVVFFALALACYCAASFTSRPNISRFFRYLALGFLGAFIGAFFQ